MVSRDTEEQRQPESSVEEDGAGEYEQEEAEALHDPSIADTQPLSAARFFARLRTELADRSIDYNSMPKFTVEGGTPPCFAIKHADFAAWAAMASHLGAAVNYRLDMPAEPNYCVDCTRRLKATAVKAGACLFPQTRFEAVRTSETANGKTLIEYEIQGCSRSKEIAIRDAEERSLLDDLC